MSDYNNPHDIIKSVCLNIQGQTYHFWQTPDRRWYAECNGKVWKTSGRRVANEIWLYGDKAQREEERLERQQLFQRLQEKRSRQLQLEEVGF